MVAVRFGIDFVAEFDQQCHVLIGAKASIQAKVGLHRIGVGGVLLLEPFQAQIQAVQLGQLLLVMSVGLLNPLLRFFPCILSAV